MHFLLEVTGRSPGPVNPPQEVEVEVSLTAVARGVGRGEEEVRRERHQQGKRMQVPDAENTCPLTKQDCWSFLNQPVSGGNGYSQARGTLERGRSGEKDHTYI